jgi:citrate synthase
MDRLITRIAHLGLDDPHKSDSCHDANLEKSLRLIAAVPTLIAADHRIRIGEEPIPPDDNLGLAANFLRMYFGKHPSEQLSDCFEASLILYAEHTFNASTFTARVIASTLSDIYSAVIGGVCAIKGHLHGGANEDVMHMLIEIDNPENALPWVRRKLRKKEKIPGFGHRVYKRGDSRYPIMKRHLARLSNWSGNYSWYEICEILESYMIERKGIHPNLDFASGPAYYLMGIDIDLFTPLFAMARTVGWTANIMEQYAHNKLIRPLSFYSGSPIRKFVQIDAR